MNNLTLATIFVIASEAAVWSLLYVRTCYRNKRLPFGKLRVKLFRYLLSRTGNIRYRLFYARVLFGSSPLSDWVDRRIASDKELEHRVRHAIAVTSSCKPCKEKVFDYRRRKTLKDCIAKNETTETLDYDMGGEG